MNEFEKLESALVQVGREMEFPATPVIATRVRAEIASATTTRRVEMRTRDWSRVLVPIAAALILAIALLFAIPSARDAVAQFLGLNGLRIFYATPTPTAPPTFTPRPNVTPTETPRPSPTATIRPSTLCCEMTLTDVQKRARFKLLLPANQLPTKVYYQNVYDNGEQVVMVFGDAANPKFTLYQAQRWIYGKLLGGETQTVIQETQVNGVRALWFHGAPHIVMQLDAKGEPIYTTERIVDANTLVWETGNEYDGMIYRVETKASLQEAVRFAESLR